MDTTRLLGIRRLILKYDQHDLDTRNCEKLIILY